MKKHKHFFRRSAAVLMSVFTLLTAIPNNVYAAEPDETTPVIETEAVTPEGSSEVLKEPTETVEAPEADETEESVTEEETEITESEIPSESESEVETEPLSEEASEETVSEEESSEAEEDGITFTDENGIPVTDRELTVYVYDQETGAYTKTDVIVSVKNGKADLSEMEWPASDSGFYTLQDDELFAYIGVTEDGRIHAMHDDGVYEEIADSISLKKLESEEETEPESTSEDESEEASSEEEQPAEEETEPSEQEETTSETEQESSSEEETDSAAPSQDETTEETKVEESSEEDESSDESSTAEVTIEQTTAPDPEPHTVKVSIDKEAGAEVKISQGENEKGKIDTDVTFIDHVVNIFTGNDGTEKKFDVDSSDNISLEVSDLSGVGAIEIKTGDQTVKVDLAGINNGNTILVNSQAEDIRLVAKQEDDSIHVSDYPLYDVFAEVVSGVQLERTGWNMDFYNTFVDEESLKNGKTISELVTDEYITSENSDLVFDLNPTQLIETSPVFKGSDGFYYAVTSIPTTEGQDPMDYQAANQFFTDLGEAYKDIEYIGKGVFRIPEARFLSCFEEKSVELDGADQSFVLGLRIQALYAYTKEEATGLKAVPTTVTYPDGKTAELHTMVDLQTGNATIEVFDDEYEITLLPEYYSIGLSINGLESAPDLIGYGNHAMVFSVGDPRAVEHISIMIDMRDVDLFGSTGMSGSKSGIMRAAANTLKALPAKSLLRAASINLNFGELYNNTAVYIDGSKVSADLAVGDKFYWTGSDAEIRLAGWNDATDGAGKLHKGMAGLSTKLAQGFSLYNGGNEVAAYQWFQNSLNNPNASATSVPSWTQMTDAAVQQRIAMNYASAAIGGQQRFGYITANPLRTPTSSSGGKTIDLGGTYVAISCMHAWSSLGVSDPVYQDILSKVRAFTGDNGTSADYGYSSHNDLTLAMQVTDIVKDGNLTYVTMKVCTSVLQVSGVIQGNYQCGFSTLKVVFEKEENGKLKLTKSSANTSITSGNSCYDLTGAQYTVYTTRACTTVAKDANGNNAVLTVADNNGTTNTLDMKAGTYYVKETKAGKGYGLDTTPHEVTVTAGATATVSVTDIPYGDPIRVLLQKRDKRTGIAVQGNGTLEGAEFTVKFYPNTTGSGSPARTWVLKTDNRGRVFYLNSYKVAGDDLYTNSVGDPQIPAGTITIQETKAPTGYEIDTTVHTVHFNIQSDNTVAPDVTRVTVDNEPGLDILAEEQATMGALEVKKTDSTNVTPEGDADISGIRFAVVNRSTNAVQYFNTSYAPGQVITFLTTAADGTSKTEANSLPYGSYDIIELRQDATIAAGETYDGSTKLGTSIYANGTGYLYKNQYKNVTITTNGETSTGELSDDILKGAVKIEKWDKELNQKTAQGDAGLAGITFSITNKSKNPVVVNGSSKAVGEEVLTITTDATGTAQSEQVLPYGTYSIKESATNGSYLLTDSKEYTFTIRESGTVVTADTAGTAMVFNDIVRRGGVKVPKIDAETSAAEAQGLATLQGAEITIYNNSSAPVLVNGTQYAKGDAVYTLVTAEDGTAQTAADLLPYGSYYLKETKASEGYNLNDSWRVDFQIREDGKIVEISNDQACEEQIKRADLTFQKVDIDGSAMPNIPFLIERLDENGKAVEAHVIVTDSKGRLDTSTRPKTGAKVNSLDQYLENGWFTDDSKLDGTTGIWFGEQSAKEDGKGALIYANYRITEIKCEANKTHDVLMQLMLDESDMENLNTVFTDGRNFNLAGIFIDLEVHPESDFIEKQTGGKTATFGEAVVYTDTIRYDHLKIYNTYKVLTEVYYVDHDGNGPTLLGSHEQEFVPAKVDSTETSNGLVTNDVTLNTTELDGGTLHAVDIIYVKHEDSWTELIRHNETMTDERQMVFVPWMSTSARDGYTNDHVGTVAEDAKLIDTVIYENLADQKMYLFEGTLRYADSGEIVKDAAGNDCVVTQTVRVSSLVSEPEEKEYGLLIPVSGQFDMPEFTFDATDLGNKTLVVTEIMYDYDTNEKVLEHHELDDEGQSVHFVEITTTAKDGKTGTRTATVGKTETIIDTVIMKNTIPGMSYTITGDLVYNKDCKDANGVEHKKGDVIAVHEPVEIVAESDTITIDLTYEVDSSALEGISGVVFEDAYHENVEIATHHDYEAIPQTPNWPKVRTSAVDGATNARTGVVGETATIVDTVSLTNLTVGDTYKVSGRLMVKDGTPFTVDGKEITVESEEFVADSTEKTLELTFSFNSSELAGKSLVVFEKLFCNEVDVSRHEDLTDENQTVDYPEGHTNANDGKTGDEVGTVGETETIIDTVTYKNLHIGDEYTITGNLHYKEDFVDKDGKLHAAGDVVLNENGEEITKSDTFVADKKDGTRDIVFTVNSELLRGASVVVFEDFYVNKVKVYAHEDLEDEDQRVDYPDVKTKAEDARTEDNVGSVGEVSIIDTVSLTNLTVGKEYKVTGVLMDKDTGEALVDDEGNEITSESEPFTATEKDMEIEMTFTASVEQIAGKTTVVFEDLVHNEIVVSYHHDIEDEEQTVHFPEIGTTAIADDTEDHVTKAREDLVITDTVHYKNLLTDGREYTVTGTLMNKDTEQPLLIDGKEVTKSKPFVPKETEGDVELEFTINAADLKGTTIVVFESVEYKGVEVAVHADINDEDQTIYIPEIRTKAHDAETEIDHSMNEEKVTLIDTVTYTDLMPGKEYVMKGYLVNKVTGEPVLENGEVIAVEQPFTPQYTMGQVEMTFTFNGKLLKNDPIVVFESVYYNDIEVAVHADIKDDDQSDWIPEIGTTALAGDTNDHITNADEEVTIIDTVYYEGLKPNTDYEVTGVLMDKETGKPIEVDGEPVERTRKFTTPEAENEEVRVDGSVDVEFTFDGSLLAGKTTVVFETLYREGRKVAVHADIEDENQTIHFPDAKTTATDTATETHTAHLDEQVEIEDVVKYTNLIPGKTYTITGTLMVKETGKALLDEDGEPIAVTKEFKADKADGEETLSFTIDSTKLVGKHIVVFEDVKYEKITVVLHADLEDEDQTVVVPEIGTTAKDKASQSKTMTVDTITELVIVDTVKYSGLTPGVEYTIKGEIMDKATGESFKDIKAEAKFTPKETDGEESLEFKFTYDQMIETELVVFETVYDAKGNLIAEHKELEDEDQTVKVVIPEGTVTVTPPDYPPQILGIKAEYAGMYMAGLLMAMLTALFIALVLRRKHLMAAVSTIEAKLTEEEKGTTEYREPKIQKSESDPKGGPGKPGSGRRIPGNPKNGAMRT